MRVRNWERVALQRALPKTVDVTHPGWVTNVWGSCYSDIYDTVTFEWALQNMDQIGVSDPDFCFENFRKRWHLPEKHYQQLVKLLVAGEVIDEDELLKWLTLDNGTDTAFKACQAIKLPNPWKAQVFQHGTKGAPLKQILRAIERAASVEDRWAAHRIVFNNPHLAKFLVDSPSWRILSYLVDVPMTAELLERYVAACYKAFKGLHDTDTYSVRAVLGRPDLSVEQYELLLRRVHKKPWPYHFTARVSERTIFGRSWGSLTSIEFLKHIEIFDMPLTPGVVREVLRLPLWEDIRVRSWIARHMYELFPAVAFWSPKEASQLQSLKTKDHFVFEFLGDATLKIVGDDYHTVRKPVRALRAKHRAGNPELVLGSVSERMAANMDDTRILNLWDEIVEQHLVPVFGAGTTGESSQKWEQFFELFQTWKGSINDLVETVNKS